MNVRSLWMGSMLFACTTMQAQNTYLNDRLTAVDDVHGTARYVGMGGALGALGADLSVISSNPAGIGLYRKSDIGMSFGVVIPHGNGWDSNDQSSYGENLSRASFDQLGFVWSNRGDGKLKFWNLAFNYQKKANYNQGFFADNPNLKGFFADNPNFKGLSQLDQVAELVNGHDGKTFATDHNLAGLARVPYEKDRTKDYYYLAEDPTTKLRYNAYDSKNNAYSRHQRGALQAYDFNASFNIDDRVYTGVTFGVENLTYNEWSEYGERGNDGGLNHSLYNDVKIDGYGMNLKFGLIVRPIVESSFRVGLAAETPTWYRLSNSTLFNLDKSDQLESYLEYTIRTPWKGRFSMGSTVGSVFAWGLEYEFANYGKTTMGYPKWDQNDPNHSGLASKKDVAMTNHTRQTLQGQHTLKLGVEVKPISAVAIRAGYNYISGRYKNGATFDQYNINSRAMDYATHTDYMTLGDANIVTLGLGWKAKHFYIDMSYKFRAQSGNFYAFDTSGMKGSIDPVKVNLNKHQVQLGLGFKY